MLRHLIRGGCTLIAASAMLALPVAAAAARPAHFDPPKRYYLALGDSIGYGFQTSKALAGLPPQAFNTGYVDLFSARLRHLRPGITTVNFSCPGESTMSFSAPCTWKHPGTRCTTTTPDHSSMPPWPSSPPTAGRSARSPCR
jgi:hypothetical protein